MQWSCFIMVSLLVASGAEGLTREYFNDKLSMNWTNAESYCIANYSGLAIVTNHDELQRSQQLAIGYTWIGLHREAVNSSVFLWSDDNGVCSYFPWATGQPNNFANSQNCIVTIPGGWNDYFCWYVLSFICYRSIILVKENKTWEQAQDYCRTHYKSLAHPSTDTQLEMAEWEAAQGPGDLVWMGMRFLNGNWYWVNGKHLNASIGMPACTSSPTGCGARNIYKGVWENKPCNQKLPFLCYK